MEKRKKKSKTKSQQLLLLDDGYTEVHYTFLSTFVYV